jgi:hypothetical protein
LMFLQGLGHFDSYQNLIVLNDFHSFLSVELVQNLVLLSQGSMVLIVVSLRDNTVAQKASKMLSSHSSLQYEYFHIIISILCCV